MKEGPSQSKWPNYFSPFIADPMALIRFHGYKIALNTNPSSSIPHTPVWPPPFSCTAAVLTSLSLVPPQSPFPQIPPWFLLLHQPEPPLVPCLLA